MGRYSFDVGRSHPFLRTGLSRRFALFVPLFVKARIALELQRLHLVTLTGPTGTAQHTTALTTAQREILAALKADPPPRVTALTPA